MLLFPRGVRSSSQEEQVINQAGSDFTVAFEGTEHLGNVAYTARRTLQGASAMSREENKILVHRFNDEYINAGNLAAADELVAIDIVDHTGPPGLKHGRESHKKAVALFHAAFPDVRWTL